MQDHLFVASDGSLHDVRVVDWSATVLRANFNVTHRNISSTADYKATLRAGPYAWPGGYQMYLITADGAALCFKCGRLEWPMVCQAITAGLNNGWRVLATEINYEDTDLECDHCADRIPAAYGE